MAKPDISNLFIYYNIILHTYVCMNYSFFLKVLSQHLNLSLQFCKQTQSFVLCLGKTTPTVSSKSLQTECWQIVNQKIRTCFHSFMLLLFFFFMFLFYFILYLLFSFYIWMKTVAEVLWAGGRGGKIKVSKHLSGWIDRICWL